MPDLNVVTEALYDGNFSQERFLGSEVPYGVDVISRLIRRSLRFKTYQHFYVAVVYWYQFLVKPRFD